MKRVRKGKTYYVFIGGSVHPGETVEAAVLREALEETSLKIAVNRLLYRQFYAKGDKHFYYLCDYLGGKPKLGNANEKEVMRRNPLDIYEPVWLNLKNLPRSPIYPYEIIKELKKDFPRSFIHNPKEIINSP